MQISGDFSHLLDRLGININAVLLIFSQVLVLAVAWYPNRLAWNMVKMANPVKHAGCVGLKRFNVTKEGRIKSKDKLAEVVFTRVGIS